MSRAQIEDDIFISSHVCPIFADPISFGLMFYVFNCSGIPDVAMFAKILTYLLKKATIIM